MSKKLDGFRNQLEWSEIGQKDGLKNNIKQKVVG